MSEAQTTYDLLILDRETGGVVTTSDEPRHLPTVVVASHTRPAYAVTRAIASTFGLETFALVWIPGAKSHHCAVLELRSPSIALPKALELCPPGDLTTLVDADRWTLLSQLMKGDGSQSNPFECVGWLDRLRKFYWHSEISEIEQWNCGISFALFRFSSRGVHYWFKGVGDPNVHEYKITMLLHRHAPQFVAPVIVAIDEWNAWIAEEIPGSPLRIHTDEVAWAAALADLASLHVLTYRHLDEFRAAGAMPVTNLSILSDLPNLFEEVRKAMKAQTSLRAPTLSDAELALLRGQLTEMIGKLDEFKLSDGLVHGDLGSGNVMLGPKGTTFLDWAECYIGNPLLSAEFLLASADHLSPPNLNRLRKEQILRLHPELSSGEVELLASYMPVVGPLAAAMIGWRHSLRLLHQDMFWPMLRSLFRIMHAAMAIRVEACSQREVERLSERDIHV